MKDLVLLILGLVVMFAVYALVGAIDLAAEEVLETPIKMNWR